MTEQQEWQMLEENFAAWASRKRAGSDTHDTFPQADRLLLLRRTYGWPGAVPGQSLRPIAPPVALSR